jgi:hypothetical protein
VTREMRSHKIKKGAAVALAELTAYSDRQPGSSRTRQRAALLALTGTGCGVGHPRWHTSDNGPHDRRAFAGESVVGVVNVRPSASTGGRIGAGLRHPHGGPCLQARRTGLDGGRRRLAGDDRFETQIVVMASDSDAVSWCVLVVASCSAHIASETAPALLGRWVSIRTGGCRSDLRRHRCCDQCGRPQRQIRHQGRRPTKALI